MLTGGDILDVRTGEMFVSPEQERQERWHQQEKLKWEREGEEAKIQDLEKQAAAYHRAKNIRSYLQKLERSPSDIDEEWLKWAYRQADMIDPLKKI